MNTEIVGQKNAINRKSIEKNSSSSSSSSSSNIIIAITTTATATNTTASTSSISSSSSSSSSSGSTNTNINIKSPKESIARKTLDNENNNDDTKIPTQIVTTTTTTTLTTAVVAETQKITSSPQNNELTDNLLIDTTINEQQQQQKPELKTPKTDQLMTSSTSPPTPSTTNQSDNNVKNDDDKMDIVQPVDVSATQTTATSTLYLTAQSQNISGSSSSSMSALEINEPLRLSDENEPTVPNANVHFDQIAGPSASSQARLKGNPLKRKRADSVEDFAGFDEPETQNSEKRFKDTARKSLDESQKQKNKKRQSKRKKWKSILPKPEIPINIINEKKAEIKNQSQEVINDNKSSEETNGNNNLPAMDTTENDTTLVTTPASSSIATPSTATSTAASKTSIKATPTNTEQSRALPIHIIDKPVDPLLLVPFEMGWKREFVYRGNLNVDDKRGKADIGEVYYITPKGRKLRTKAEVTSNLRGGLVIENFTFVREPLGAPSGEIVRYAKLKRTNVKHEHNFLDIGEPDPSFGFGKRIPKPKMPKGVSPPPPSTPQSLLFSSSASSSSSASTTVNALHSTTTTTPNTPLTTRPQHPLYRESSFNRRITPSVRRKSIETITEQKAKAALAMKSAKIKLSGTQPTTPVVITATAGPLTGDVTSPVKRRAAPRIQNSSSTLSRSGGGINTVNNIVTNNNNNFNEDGHGFANGNGQKIQSVIVSPPKGKFKRGTTTTIITTPQSSSYQVVQSNRPESIKNQPSVHTLFAANFFNNVSMGYDILQNVFQYLKVQEIARASRVCRMWNHTANSNSLWRTVRMKNSQVNNWMGFTNKLIRNGTKHLDLRKMIGDGELWSDFSVNIARVQNLESIDLCRCPAQIVEELFKTNPMLRILNACAIKDKELDLNNLRNLHQLTELRIKCTGNLLEIETLAPLMELSELKHLSLTSIKELGLKGIGVLGNLTKLESLELGECVEFTNNFATHVLIKLQRLEKLRLERGQDQCSTFDILDVIPKLSNLVQLELVNFDIKSGFDIRLEKCTNIKRLLLIPTYISQSATTNHMVLSGVLKLSKQLHAFTWVVTLELLRVTELYVDQYDEKRDDVRGGGGSGPGSNSTSTTAGGGGTPRIKQQPRDSIPILKPVPGLIDDHQRVHERNSDVPQVDILTLEDVEKILLNANSKLNFKMIKVSFSQTWRQNMIGSQLAT